ncbi:MAG: HEAT repeat domain-containing protein, partial [bacterium]
ESHLARRNLCGVKSVLDPLTRLEAEARRPAGFLGLVVHAGVTKEGLGRILEGMGGAPAEEVAQIEEFLAMACPWIQGALLALLTETDDRAVRKIVLGVLGAGGETPAAYLVPMLQDARWYVVRNAVQLAARSHDPALLVYLEPLVRHSDVRVRRELIRTLDALGNGPTVRLLVEALSDEDSSVRTLAAGSLGRHGGQEHEAVVRTQVEGRDFDIRPPEEVEAFLVCLAHLGKDRVVPVLDKMWRRRPFLTRPGPVRLAALRALGAIPGPEADALLKEAAKSGDAQVKSAAIRALGEAQTRGAGSRP